jgi:predicted GIY-YIG superfamily endonuclease
MLCFQCGRSGHFASSCLANVFCFRCGRSGHFSSSCFAKTSANGKFLKRSRCEEEDMNDETSSSSSSSSEDSETYQSRNKRVKTPSTDRAGVYVLKTSSGLYYVGKSQNIDARISDHRNGRGASCLAGASFQVVPNLLTVGTADDLESWERNETLQRMRTHGISNVRGWMFTSTALSDEDYQDAFRQICEKFDLCRRCGRSSHFAEQCYARHPDAWAADIF